MRESHKGRVNIARDGMTIHTPEDESNENGRPENPTAL
jgi:hypothetical protein